MWDDGGRLHHLLDEDQTRVALRCILQLRCNFWHGARTGGETLVDSQWIFIMLVFNYTGVRHNAESSRQEAELCLHLVLLRLRPLPPQQAQEATHLRLHPQLWTLAGSRPRQVYLHVTCDICPEIVPIFL